ncbi:MAG TPA: sugar phosphorylase [Gammaproteobacteria bacterium]|nr:sugar phosphorylase [Gammaproteobacteria bacterium]
MLTDPARRVEPAPVDPGAEPSVRLLARLDGLYGPARAPAIRQRILRMLQTHRQLRNRTVEQPYWTHRDIVLITYGDSIHSPHGTPLQTLHTFLNRHLGDAFSMLHLLPIFPYSSDDGFSVTDFRAVNPELGSWDDVAALERSYDLVIDLVLNHCSRENLWFIDFIAGQKPACDYFIEMEPDANLALVTRPRSSSLLSGVRTHQGLRHVWTTFSNDQIDMNYSNPDVLLEFIDILLYYIRRGARVVRLDAVGYLWKQPGTRCIHLPQTHAIIKLFRDVLEMVEPGALIMTETNVPHVENISYFGAGDEAHIVYQFSLPPLLLHALYAGNTHYLQDWTEGLEATTVPADCTFLNFTASHDGVGLRPLEGLVPGPEIDSLLETMRARGGYISMRSNSDGSVSPYELNISYYDAYRDPSRENNRWQIPAFMVSQVVALTFRGIPAVYLHCLVATPNDYPGVERTGMTRSINRRKWDQGELEALMANAGSDTGEVFRRYLMLLQIRRDQPAFHPEAPQQLLATGDSVFALERTALDGSQRILGLFNFTASTQTIAAALLPDDLAFREELIGEYTISHTEDGVQLPPYATCWFSQTPD